MGENKNSFIIKSLNKQKSSLKISSNKTILAEPLYKKVKFKKYSAVILSVIVTVSILIFVF